jgi:hypothetical protein
MKRVLFQFDDVVDALGGPTGVARLTGNLPHAIPAWRRKRGLFPSKHYFLIKCALEEQGLVASTTLFGFTDAAALRKAA